MKIKIVPPNTLVDEEYKETVEERRRVARRDTKIDVFNIKYGPIVIDNYYEGFISDLAVLVEASNAEKEGYDAVMIDCVLDGPLEILREKLNIPVIGPMEASMHLASILGRKFSIVGPTGKIEFLFRENAKKYGLEDKLASVRDIGITYEELYTKPKKEIREALLGQCKKALDEDGADTIILGCTSLIGYDEWLKKQLNVPVIAPANLAVKMLELLLDLKLTQSKRAYKTPERTYKDIESRLV